MEQRALSKTASTTLLTARDISAAPHRNAEEVLRQVPGVTLVQHGSEGKGHQFFIRGFDAIHGADFELTIDGIPINEWSNIHAQGYIDLGFIIPEVLQGVVVTKGPFTLPQGAFAMAGSADYRMGIPFEDRGFRAAYTLGTTNRHRLLASYTPSDGDGQTFAAVEGTHDDGFGESRNLNRITFNGRASLLKLGRSNLSVTALAGYSEFELPGTLRNDDVEEEFVDFYGTYDPLMNGRSTRGLAVVNYEWKKDTDSFELAGYGGYRRLDLLENFTGFLIDPDNGDRRDQFQETVSFGAQATHHLGLVESLTLHSGIGIRGDVFSQTETNVGLSLEKIEARRELTGLQMIIHGIAGFRWSPLDNLEADVGSRLDLVRVNVENALADGTTGEGTNIVVSPRATVMWHPAVLWRLFAAYGRGFRPPEARAYSGFEPDRMGIGDDLFMGGEPQTTVADAFEIGTRWDPSEWIGFSLAAFATFIERESIFDHVSGTNLELNGTRRLGGELVLYSNPLHWLSLSADLTMVDARFVESGNQVPLAPWLVSGIRAIATHNSGFRGGLRMLVVAPRPLPHGAKGATLLMTDATLGYHWRWLRVDLELENLLNLELREGEYHYTSNWRQGQPASQIPVLHTSAGPPLNARLTVGVVF